MLEQRRDVSLDRLELIELQVGIDNGKNITRVWLLINKHALPVTNDLLFYFEQPLAFQHDRQDIPGRNIVWVVLLNQFSQERFGGFLLDGVGSRQRRLVNTLPIGDETFAVAGAVAVLLLPAGAADIGAAEVRFFVKKQCVIALFISKSFAASFASVGARLNMPLSH